MLVAIIDGADYREVTISEAIKETGCIPYQLISREGMEKITEIAKLPIEAVGQVCENEKTGEKWIECSYWYTDKEKTSATWYLWCDGTWQHGTGDESVVNDIDYRNLQPVPSHKDRYYKGWFVNYRELLEAYYLAKRKDGDLSGVDYLRIKAILMVEKYWKGN